MNKLTIVVLLILAGAFQVLARSWVGYTYEQFLTDFKRSSYVESLETYDFAARKAIFNMNLDLINKHNADSTNSWTMAVNEFADLTPKEFFSFYGGYQRDTQPVPSIPRRVNKPMKFPDTVDWTNVTTVTNQGSCGSCYVFAALSAVTSQIKINSGVDIEPSYQQVVDCMKARHCGGTGGCQGGTQSQVFAYSVLAGITSGAKYPYTAKDGVCKYDHQANKPDYVIDGFKVITPNDSDALMEAIQDGPVSISVAANAMMFYSSGIFDGCTKKYNGNMEINHAVLAVGYGSEGGKKYWKIMNSWGAGWGDKGYIRVQFLDSKDSAGSCFMNKNPLSGSACSDTEPVPYTVCGECGMYAESTQPVGARVYK